MVAILLSLLIVVIVAAVAWWLISMLPVPQPWLRISQVLVILIVLLIVLGYVRPLIHVH